jgi:hypothetical protein
VLLSSAPGSTIQRQKVYKWRVIESQSGRLLTVAPIEQLRSIDAG